MLIRRKLAAEVASLFCTVRAGLVNVLVAKAFGATSIAVTDMLDANLQLASRLGATATVRVDPAAPPDRAAASLKAAFGGGEGPDIVIDCAGFESTMQVLASYTDNLTLSL